MFKEKLNAVQTLALIGPDSCCRNVTGGQLYVVEKQREAERIVWEQQKIAERTLEQLQAAVRH